MTSESIPCQAKISREAVAFRNAWLRKGTKSGSVGGLCVKGNRAVDTTLDGRVLHPKVIETSSDGFVVGTYRKGELQLIASFYFDLDGNVYDIIRPGQESSVINFLKHFTDTSSKGPRFVAPDSDI